MRADSLPRQALARPRCSEKPARRSRFRERRQALRNNRREFPVLIQKSSATRYFACVLHYEIKVFPTVRRAGQDRAGRALHASAAARHPAAGPLPSRGRRARRWTLGPSRHGHQHKVSPRGIPPWMPSECVLPPPVPHLLRALRPSGATCWRNHLGSLCSSATAQHSAQMPGRFLVQ